MVARIASGLVADPELKSPNLAWAVGHPTCKHGLPADEGSAHYSQGSMGMFLGLHRTSAVLDLVVVALLALSLRIAIVSAVASPPERFEYATIVESWIGGDGLDYPHLGTIYGAYYSGVPYLTTCAALTLAFPPGAAAIQVIQALFSVLNGAAILWIGRQAGGRGIGLTAAIMTALHPALAYYDVRKLHPLGLDALLTSLVVAGLLWVEGGPQERRRTAVAGCLLGLGILQRGSLLVLLPLACIWLWRRTSGAIAATYAAAALATVCPWLLRNYVEVGAPVLVSTTGEHFWIGNAPGSAGSNLLPSGKPVLTLMPRGLEAELSELDEVGQSRAFWRAGWTAAANDPSGFGAGLARKMVLFWSFGPQSGAWYPPIFRDSYLFYYAWVLALAAIGAWRLKGTQQGARILGVLALTFAAVSVTHSVFYAEMRHRWALEPLMLVLAAIAVSRRPSRLTRDASSADSVPA